MDKNNELVIYTKAIFESMSTHDFTTLEKIFSEDVAFDFHGVNKLEGKKRVILFLKN